MLQRLWVVLLLGAVTVLDVVNSARILCIFPTASISHQIVFRGLTLALQKRGHDLVVVTANPVRDESLENYKEIDFGFLYNASFKENFVNLRKKYDWLTFMYGITVSINENIGNVLNHPELVKIYEPNSGEHFDLVIIEMIFWESFYPIVKRFDAPWIGITSLGLCVNLQYAIGNPVMSSHPSTWELDYKVSGDLNFWQRLSNYIEIWGYLFYYRRSYIERQEEIARRYFGDYGSTIKEIEKNVSLIFVNQQTPISFVRPNVPKVIEIGGFHVAKQTKPLPEKVKKFLDEAKQGFVYMSLGSNAKSTMLSNKTRQAFIDAFTRLKYRVLWKFEEDSLPGKPDNVYTMKWVPQQSVLAHPNIKVFIYQGGLQSTEEAVSHAVPLIGFPIMADQECQVYKMTSIGVCQQLEINEFEADDLIEAIMTITTNSSYKQRMLNLRSLINDKPHDPLENAVWWTEHVIRHRGAPYLHSVTADLPWYQRGDTDLIAFLTLSCFITFSAFIYTCYRIVWYTLRRLLVNNKEKIH